MPSVLNVHFDLLNFRPVPAIGTGFLLPILFVGLMLWFMKIVLIRHGEPLFSKEKLPASQLPHLLDRYNRARLLEESHPSVEAKQIAQSSSLVICSDLPRSIESAQRLGVETIHQRDSLFREVALPHSTRLHYPSLSPYSWFLFFRLMWFMGYAKNGESIRQAKYRARQCAQQLIKECDQHGAVLFVGHGVLNHYIAKELKRSGWLGPKKQKQDYWSYGIYQRPSELSP